MVYRKDKYVEGRRITGDTYYKPILVGETERGDWFDDGACTDCGKGQGEQHSYGCDCERCPACGGQLISCDCEMYEAELPLPSSKKGVKKHV